MRKTIKVHDKDILLITGRWQEIKNLQCGDSYVNHRGRRYRLSSFLNTKSVWGDAPYWMQKYHGHQEDSFFNGTLIEISDCGNSARVTTFSEKPDCFKENNMIKVKFVGIDTLNRPVFKDIEHEDYYVSGINFFICNECEENVLKYVHSRELEYIGHSFEGSQYGIEPRQKIQIIKVNN